MPIGRASWSTGDDPNPRARLASPSWVVKKPAYFQVASSPRSKATAMPITHWRDRSERSSCPRSSPPTKLTTIAATRRPVVAAAPQA